MFSAFFEEMYKVYFDGTNLLSPVVYPGMDVSVVSLLGTVISHAYIVTGILPPDSISQLGLLFVRSKCYCVT